MPQCSILLTIRPKQPASLNEAQAGTRYLLFRKPKVDSCQGFVRLPGFADKEGPRRGKPLLPPSTFPLRLPRNKGPERTRKTRGLRHQSQLATQEKTSEGFARFCI